MSGSESVFVVVAAVGFLLLLISLIFGDFEHDMEFDGADVDHDVIGDGFVPSWFSMKMLAASAVGFGLFGYVPSSYGAPPFVSWPLALIGLLAVGAGTFFLVLKPLAKQQSNSLLSKESYRGLTAKVTTSIQPGRPGIVSFYDANGAYVSERAILVDDDSVPPGAEVFIVDINQSGVTVMPSSLPKEME